MGRFHRFYRPRRPLERVGYSSTLFLDSGTRRGEESASRPGRFLPPGKNPYPFTGGWLGPRVGLDRCGKSRPTGIRSPGRPGRSPSLYRLRYPAHFSTITSIIWFLQIATLYVHCLFRNMIAVSCLAKAVFLISLHPTEAPGALCHR
jgi:hypothetical protein